MYLKKFSKCTIEIPIAFYRSNKALWRNMWDSWPLPTWHLRYQTRCSNLELKIWWLAFALQKTRTHQPRLDEPDRSNQGHECVKTAPLHQLHRYTRLHDRFLSIPGYQGPDPTKEGRTTAPNVDVDDKMDDEPFTVKLPHQEHLWVFGYFWSDRNCTNAEITLHVYRKSSDNGVGFGHCWHQVHHLVCDYGCHRHTIKRIPKCPPQFHGISPFAFIIETCCT